jgi:hypothetical protein
MLRFCAAAFSNMSLRKVMEAVLKVEAEFALFPLLKRENHLGKPPCLMNVFQRPSSNRGSRQWTIPQLISNPAHAVVKCAFIVR